MPEFFLRPEPTEFLIWSYEHRAWWAPNECGYTPDFAGAGTYSKQQADRIVAHAYGFEVAIPKDAVLELMNAQMGVWKGVTL